MVVPMVVVLVFIVCVNVIVFLLQDCHPVCLKVFSYCRNRPQELYTVYKNVYLRVPPSNFSSRIVLLSPKKGAGPSKLLVLVPQDSIQPF